MQGLAPTSSTMPNAGMPSNTSSLMSMQGLNLTSGQQVAGQVIGSQTLEQGQGYKIEVELTNGQRVSLFSDKPLAEGQLLQLTGRDNGQVEVRLLNSLQQLAHQVIQQLPPLNITSSTGQTLNMPLGQAFLAQVVSSQPAMNGNFDIQLKLSTGQTLNIQAPKNLEIGSQVHLNSGAKGVELRVLTPEISQLLSLNNLAAPVLTSSATANTNAEPVSLQSLLASASAQLRLALPRQLPLATALNNLSQLQKQLPANPTNTATVNNPATPNTTTTTATVSSPANQQFNNQVNQILSTIMRLVPQGQQPPSAASLQQFLPLSGLLLEANLLRGGANSSLNQDLKLLLQQASNLLRQGNGTNSATNNRQQVLQNIAQQVQASLARIQVQQNSSLQANIASHERGQPAQVLQLDLPYVVKGEWFEAQLEIRRWLEEKEAEEALEEHLRRTRSWEVKLSFNLEEWGKIHTLLRLKNEELKADIWVEEKGSLSYIKDKAQVLAARLRRVGADVEEVYCHLGSPPNQNLAAKRQQIIDTKV